MNYCLPDTETRSQVFDGFLSARQTQQVDCLKVEELGNSSLLALSPEPYLQPLAQQSLAGMKQNWASWEAYLYHESTIYQLFQNQTLSEVHVKPHTILVLVW